MSAVAVHERIVLELARRLYDGDTAILGSFTPIGYAAALLAKATHAPNLDFIAYGFGGSQVGWLGFLSVEGRAMATGAGLIRTEDLVGAMRFRGVVAFEPVRPAQVDGQGRMNLRRLATGNGGCVRLPGTAGAQEVIEMHRRPLGYLPEHSLRTCVAEVDDVSLQAHLPHEQRQAFVLVTEKAVLEFGLEGWTILSRHPGVDSEELAASTGFPLLGADAAPITSDPEPEVLITLREEVDPLGVAATELMTARERRHRLEAIFIAEEERLERN
jgi:hypothetical protein